MMGNRLRELRKAKELSLDEMIKEFNEIYPICLSKTSLSNYERGKQEPNQKTWTNLADFFECSTAYVMRLSNTTEQSVNFITLSKFEYDRLKKVESRYNEIKKMVVDVNE